MQIESIGIDVERENMQLVPIKTEEQLDVQALHRVRKQLVSRDRIVAVSIDAGHSLLP